MNAQGSLLAIQSTGLPHLSDFQTDPGIADATARASAIALFADEFGVSPTQVDVPKLIIAQTAGASSAQVARLAWQVETYWIPEHFEPEGRTYLIDAINGNLLESESNVHFAVDVSGIVVSSSTSTRSSKSNG